MLVVASSTALRDPTDLSETSRKLRNPKMSPKLSPMLGPLSWKSRKENDAFLEVRPVESLLDRLIPSVSRPCHDHVSSPHLLSSGGIVRQSPTAAVNAGDLNITVQMLCIIDAVRGYTVDAPLRIAIRASVSRHLCGCELSHGLFL